MSEPKETMFLSRNDFLNKRFDWYKGLFYGVKDEIYIGESSTEYTKAPELSDAPKNIASYCKNPKFIYIMRDPLERIISHYWYYVKTKNEHRSIDNVILKEIQYINISNYALQLKLDFEYFDREKFFIHTFEALKNNIEETLKSIFNWLNVDDSFMPENILRGT